ncbi:MAG TPA: tRNA (adenosine(37)-N6)-threonylcarbamoyltransferase complex ATPase subunit type 1 TsaE [Nitrospiria bacterium]|nr:tRNA (adenosine(37)-N6)-threonylcarbamoyltransferase complex ATPase subunit type 1 TsaE [Nitrospiria bacterium]
MTAHTDSVTFFSRSAAETGALARRVAGLLRGGETIALIGPIGAGKTTWVQGLAGGLGCPDRPNSPTFVLQQWYRAGPSAHRPIPVLVCHLDLYRLDEPAEIARLGLLEPLDSQQVTVIEWADRAGSLLPPDRLDLTFHRPVTGDETARIIVAQVHGRGHEHLMAAFQPLS